MSKYIKLEDALKEFNYGADYPVNTIIDILYDLPTIEVSEDCISREWVLKAIDAEDVGTPDEMWRPAREYVEMIKSAPSVVPSRAEGEWIEEVGDCEGKSVRYICSQCCDDDGWINYNYCPNCGSKMKGAEE